MYVSVSIWRPVKIEEKDQVQDFLTEWRSSQLHVYDRKVQGITLTFNQQMSIKYSLAEREKNQAKI